MDTEPNIQEAVQAATEAARHAAPLVQFVEPTFFTDSTGDAAIRFEVTLADPPYGGIVEYLDVEPVKKAIYDHMADVGLVVYVNFRSDSEQQAVAAGNYYG